MNRRFFFSDNHGNNIMNQCKILVYLWFATSKVPLDIFIKGFVYELSHEFPNNLESKEARKQQENLEDSWKDSLLSSLTSKFKTWVIATTNY